MLNDATMMGMRIFTGMTTDTAIPFFKRFGFIHRATYRDPQFPECYTMIREATG